MSEEAKTLCGSCRWWSQKVPPESQDGSLEWGTCRRRAPVGVRQRDLALVEYVGNDGKVDVDHTPTQGKIWYFADYGGHYESAFDFTRWPQTSMDDWCGDSEGRPYDSPYV